MATKGITVDEKFLQDFLAKGGEAETPTGRKVDISNADEVLQAYTETKPSETTKKVDAQLSKSENEETKARREAQEARRQEIEQQKQQEAQLGAVRKAVDTVSTPLSNAADRIGSFQTVGGVGTLLVILMILLFTIVQVNRAGDTRLKMLWYMLLGRANLTGHVTPEQPVQPPSFQQELTNVSTASAQFIGDVGTVVENAATNAVSQATGVSPDIIGAIGTGIANSIGFRYIP